MRVPHDARVLVADGAKMLFFRNEGDADQPVLKILSADEQTDARDRDIKTDSAGQKPGGSTAGEPDYHRQAEDRFAADAAAMLNKGALANAYEKLIVVASPKTLGELRHHYHKETQSRLLAEIPKDLARQPVDKIEAALLAHETH
jgi:protein required for attachment to host cells